MSLLSDIKTILGNSTINVPCETGVYKGTAPSVYAVLTPLSSSFECFDDKPDIDIQEVRIVLYSKGNYTAAVKKIIDKCIAEDITITGRQYITHEDESGYHQYAIDVAKNYLWEV